MIPCFVKKFLAVDFNSRDLLLVPLLSVERLESVLQSIEKTKKRRYNCGWVKFIKRNNYGVGRRLSNGMPRTINMAIPIHKYSFKMG